MVSADDMSDENGAPLDVVELDKLANKLIIAIKAAAESRTTKLMITALDMLQVYNDITIVSHYFRN